MNRIFISYGHKDAVDFARKLSAWLRDQGYEPWLDVENGIPVGAQFDVCIELGIWHSEVVVALLSPWGLRPDGFCRNEILYAAHIGRPIIPVRLAEVTPPIQIIGLSYIDAARDREIVFSELPAALSQVAAGGGLELRHWGPESQPAGWWMRLKSDRFEEELARHGGSFVGREWLFDKVRAWAAEPDSRLLLVAADAGFGKSAAAAQISARLNVHGVHFCTRSIPESCRPDRWLGGLVYQLAAQFPAYREILAEMPTEPNWVEPPESLFRKLVADPLRAIRDTSTDLMAQGEPWVFIIDALDEAWAEAGPGMVELLVDSVERIPDFLRVVATCRPDRHIIAQFKLDGVQRQYLDAGDENNRRDLQIYVERRLEALRDSSSVPLPLGAAEQLVKTADGNFLFAKLSLDALNSAEPDSRLSLEDIGLLQPKLSGLYCAMFRKRFKDQARYEREFLPVLEVLIAAQGPISEGLLREASGLHARTAARGIAALSQFLTGGTCGLRLFHQSLADWLCNAEDSTDFLVSPDTGHDRLANIGWREFDDARSQPDPYSLSPYMLAHLPAHLSATGQWERLAALLTDLRYVEQRVASGQIFDLIRSYNAAIAVLPEARSARQKQTEIDTRSVQWTKAIMSYAARWSAWRDHQAIGAATKGPENSPPNPPAPCRMWTDEEIRAEHDRIICSPARGDRIGAFARFASSQCYPLAEFGHRPGFTRQHAFNWELAGPVHGAAKVLIANIDTVWAERKWPKEAMPNPRPAELRTLEGHSDVIWTACVSADGRRAISGSSDKTLRVWDLESGACLRVLKGHSDRIRSVSMTPDGGFAVSGSSDRTLRVWDLANGICRSVLEGHTDGISSVSVTPDGRRAVSGSSDKTLRVWDLENSRCERVLEGHVSGLGSVSVTPDGRRAISIGWDNTLRVWDLESWVSLGVFGSHDHVIENLSVTADGRRAVTSGSDKALRVWDLESGVCLRAAKGGERWIRSLAITPDGRRAILGNDDNALRVWDLESDTCLRELEGHSDWIQCVGVTPDGRRAVSCSSDKTLRFWDLESGAGRRVNDGHSHLIESMSVTPDGRCAVTGSSDRTLRIWDLQSGACKRELEERNHWIRCMGVTEDGRRAILGSWDKTLRFWDLESGTCLRALEGHVDWIRSVSVTPDGRLAISSSADKTLRVWDLEAGSCLRVLEGDMNGFGSASVTPDGRRAVAGDSHNRIRIWDLESGSCSVLGDGHTDLIQTVSMTPDGRRAVSGSTDKSLRVWDLGRGVCLHVLEGHTHAVTSVCVTPDGCRAISGSDDNTLRVWDLDSGQCLGVYRAPVVGGALAAFNDGRGVCLPAGSEILVLEIHGIRPLI